MSSILEALKKVERESAAGDGKDVPWPTMSVNSTVDVKRRRHLWWIPLGVIAVSFVIASVFWLTQRPSPDQQHVVTKGAIEPLAAAKTETVPPPTRHAVPAVPSSPPPARLPQKKPVPAITPKASLVKPPPQNETKEIVTSEARPSFAKSPQKEPTPDVTPEAEPTTITPPPEASTQREAEMVEGARLSEDSPENNSKEYRSDERIDLQALVWAPQAADRFVVINNILLKEGGSIDKITVVRINEDDVLLSEGSDRWYQEFKIR